MPVEVAAPLAVLVSITVALVVVVQDWHHIHLRSAGWLVLPLLLGLGGVAVAIGPVLSARARRVRSRAPTGPAVP